MDALRTFERFGFDTYIESKVHITFVNSKNMAKITIFKNKPVFFAYDIYDNDLYLSSEVINAIEAYHRTLGTQESLQI